LRTKLALLVVLGVATLMLASVATGRTGAETLKFNAVLTIANADPAVSITSPSDGSTRHRRSGTASSSSTPAGAR